MEGPPTAAAETRKKRKMESKSLPQKAYESLRVGTSLPLKPTGKTYKA